jgi:hypothetical protein
MDLEVSTIFVLASVRTLCCVMLCNMMMRGNARSPRFASVFWTLTWAEEGRG